MSDICQAIKLLAQETIDAQKPTDVVFGKVLSVEPLKIETEQKLILDDRFVSFAESMKERRLKASIDGETVIMTITVEICKDDTVIMLRPRGGQRYIVIDRE